MPMFMNLYRVTSGIAASASNTNFTLETLTTNATSILTWFLTSMGSILNFLLSNPALLIWFIVSLIGAAFVYIRKLM